MDKARLANLIQKLRLGEISPEEKDELDAFWLLAQSDETRFEKLSEDEKDLARRMIYEGVRSRIRSTGPDRATVRSLSSSSRWLLKIAASVAVLIVLSIYWTKLRPPVDRELHTAYGEQMTVKLPDQSTVVLNGNTTLRFSPSWSPDVAREVWIRGEAYFEVIHTQNDQKFIVHTENDMDVQVLGTKFNVKAREDRTQVMLEEGSVRLEIGINNAKETLVMVAGELATLHNDTLSKTSVKSEVYVSWTENKLVFDQTTLVEVASMLKDTYGMNVVFEDEELTNRKLSGEISVYQVDDILKAIKASMELEISRTGNEIVFHAQSNPNSKEH